MMHKIAKKCLMLYYTFLLNELTFFGTSSKKVKVDLLIGEKRLSSEEYPSIDSITLRASFNSFASNKHFTVKYAQTTLAYKKFFK